MRRRKFSKRESGQAAVETALTLPITLFLFFGTLQLILMMQGRIIAQYAVSRATRAASLNHGDCAAMKDVSLAVLLPALQPFMKPGVDKVDAFIGTYTGKNGVDWRKNRYDYASSSGGPRGVVWIDRISPDAADVTDELEETFDIKAPATGARPMRLETRMVFWFPLKIPFANWVLSHIALTQLGLEPYQGIDPLSPTMEQADWKLKSPTQALSAEVKSELRDRIGNDQFAFPIVVSSVLRMMTPPRKKFFKSQNCTR